MQKQVPFGEANRLKFPEQVVIALARDAGGKCNPITLGWAMQTSISPPMMAISIGLPRYSHEVFQNAEDFVIAMPSELQEKETLFYGTKSGRDVDKLAEFGATLQPAAKVDCVLLAEAVANFECRKAGELLTGDHTIFVGEVVCAHAHEKEMNRLYTLGQGYQMGGLARP
ncbi:MAG TPA: flavin reductase family protein [Phycisphaerae bacterium]|nr:flavin reductase family protein [Phycisphaerae bacterium]